MFRSLRFVMTLLAAMGAAASLFLAGQGYVFVKQMDDSATKVFVAKDIVADILPPPLYLIEARLVLSLMLDGSMPVVDGKKRFEELAKEYAGRVEHWKNTSSYGLDAKLLGNQHTAGQAFIEAARNKVVEPLVANQEDVAKANLPAVQALYMEHRAGVDATVVEGNKFAEESVSDFAKTQATSSNVMIATAIATCLVVFTIGFFIIRSTNKALRAITIALENGAVQTAAAAGDVSSASQGLSSGATEQAAAIEETSASLEEISSMIRATAENAQKAKQLASEARNFADSGTRTMTEMNDAMAAIDSSSAEVAKIVKNIDEIAFQTNILALNAAVEAARAGEAGAGFAVVADEVRSLAQRSAAAARETAEKIDTAIANSRRGAECTSEVGRSLLSITEKVTATDTLVGDIASAAREQAQGITQISVAINQMDSISQTNSATAEQCASSAEQLSAQAEDFKGLVKRLGSLVGGSAAKGSSEEDYEIHAPARTRARARPAVQNNPGRPMQSLAGGRKQVAGPAVRRPGPPASIPMPAETAEGSGEPEAGSFRNF